MNLTYRKLIRSIVFLHAFACLSPAAFAINDAESLALLVETLDMVDDPGVRGALLKGMLSGLEGRRNVTAPRGWSKLSEKLATSENANVRELSMQLSQFFGDRAATERALELVKDSSAATNRRRTALRALLSQQDNEASSLLKSLLDEPDFTLDAIRGYAAVSIGGLVIRRILAN